MTDAELIARAFARAEWPGDKCGDAPFMYNDNYSFDEETWTICVSLGIGRTRVHELNTGPYPVLTDEVREVLMKWEMENKP